MSGVRVGSRGLFNARCLRRRTASSFVSSSPSLPPIYLNSIFCSRTPSTSSYSLYSTATAAATTMSRPDITLYTAQTPNGIKISIALEELGYADIFIG